MAFFKLFGAVCRCCSAKYRELWLVCERGNDARDNGYWFYRYLKEEHPEINARYVIETESADRAKIEALGGCLLYTSPSPRDGATSRMPSSA